MKVALSEQMRQLDREAMESVGIPGIALMENAAREVSLYCYEYLLAHGLENVLIFAGRGNNGGDGLAAARRLKNKGINVLIYFIGDTAGLSGDALTNFNIVKNMGISVIQDFSCLEDTLSWCDLILDAIFGTGLKGVVKGEAVEVIERINVSGKYVVSCDIPSGIDADTGKVLGCAVKADATVTFALPKVGLLLYPGKEYTGEMKVADISIPSFLYQRIGMKCSMLTKEEAKALLPGRKERSNKGTYGRLFCMAGSKEMTGANYLACKSAYRTGAGVVYSCSVQNVLNVIQTLLPEAVGVSLTEEHGQVRKESFDDIGEKIKDAAAIVLGPGLGTGENVQDFVREVLTNCKVPMVVDADAINAIAQRKDISEFFSPNVILTPHPGEMSRLTGKSVSQILEEMVETASSYAKENQAIVVLKDARTVIAHPDGRVYINTTGCAAMAKGGSGDVLSGIIGGLLSQGAEPFDAAVLGVYLHGLAGEIAGRKHGAYSTLAGEICDCIRDAFDEVGGVLG